MIETNEKSTLVITVTFKDENNELVIPTSAEYRIDDVNSGNMIRDWTPMPSLASSVDIVISASESSIIASKRIYEDKELTVRFTYSANKAGSAQQLFRVRNMIYMT
jgi:hypothetical protein